MKTLTRLALAAALATTAITARADWVSAHFRSYGTFVTPYYRTPANGLPCDNSSYRCYPSPPPVFIPPSKPSSGSSITPPNYDFPELNRWSLGDSFGSRMQTMPKLQDAYRTLTFGY